MGAQNNAKSSIDFIDNRAIKGREDLFTIKTVKLSKIVKAWRESMFSHEWLDSEGIIRNIDDLNPSEQTKRQDVETLLENNSPLSRPVLGLGMSDNVEIGAGRHVLLTLAALGYTQIPVHLPKSCLELFQDYLA